MELIELREKTREYFKNDNVDAVEMMIIWLMYLSDDEENEYFFLCKVGIEEWIEFLKSYIKEGGRLPEEELTQALCSKTDNVLSALDLVQHVLSTEEYGVTTYLKRNNVDVAHVLRNIEEAEPYDPWVDVNLGGFGHGYFESPLGENLTKKAFYKEYEEYEYREEITDIANILHRKDKANVIVTGQAGIGKTALIATLAKACHDGDIEGMEKIEFFHIQMDSLLAKTSYIGGLEHTIEGLMRDIEAHENVVLVIDEIHQICMTHDGKRDSNRIADSIKPYIGQSKCRVIGMTTTEDYQRYIEKNKALARRFIQLRLSEPSGETLKRIVRRYAEALMVHHHCSVTNKIIDYGIELANKFLKHKNQPDKTCEILDTAAVIATRAKHKTIKMVDVAKAVSMTTKLPIERVQYHSVDANKLAHQLKQSIFGQDDAVQMVAESLMVSMAGFRSGEAPMATFLFAGDSGVGKTALARALGKTLMGDELRTTIIDMAEYSQRHMIGKLIGSPPGYIDSDKEGIIPAALMENPHGVIVFDEIEKAAPEVHRLLLGMLDAGRITSAMGVTYDASNNIIILTTNAVTSKSIQKSQIGFGNKTGLDQSVKSGLAETFPNEFLGRIDDIIMFKPLDLIAYREIIGVEIDEVIAQINASGCNVCFEKTQLEDYVIDQIVNQEFGAREIKKIIRKKLTVPLAFALSQCKKTKQIDLDAVLFKKRDEMNQET